VWGITSVSLPGAAEAVRQAAKSGQIYVTGLSLPNTMRSYVKDGTVPKFVLWNPVDLGYLTVQVGKQLAEGSLPPGPHDFGRLKNIHVSEGEVLLGPPLVFARGRRKRCIVTVFISRDLLSASFEERANVPPTARSL
jgi:ABC-type sugar transport system substrate-binding protein